jgi:DNA invertase Pin-like site-specific DNA recombinase
VRVPPAAREAGADRERLVVDGYIAPECGLPSAASVQRWQIAKWTAERGWRLGRVLQAPEHRVDRCPALSEALERVEAGESDGVVVVKLDHLGASLAQALAAIERIQAAGGAFASVRDGIDLSTQAGRTVLRMLLTVADWRS